MQFIILLRGVNVGGKNRVPMSVLKQYLIDTGFTNVRSHINSGNLIVDSAEGTEQDILVKCQNILASYFAFPVDIVIISGKKYQMELAGIPTWWGEDADYKHNALFLLPSANKKEIVELLSAIDTTYEKVYIGKHAIFWSSAFKNNYSKTYYSKLAHQSFYKKVTVRNRNTTLKLLNYLED